MNIYRSLEKKQSFPYVHKEKKIKCTDKQKTILKCKKYLKRVCATVLISCGIYAIASASLLIDIVASAHLQGMMDFEEKTTYSANASVVPGYYNEHPLKVYISDDFSYRYTKEIIDAIKYVDGVATGLKFAISSNVDDSNIQIYKNNNIDCLGCAYPSSGKIYINDDVFHHKGVEATVIHEIAHILGLEHSKDLSSIMYPVVSQKEFSERDIKNLNTIWPARTSSANKYEYSMER